MINKNTKNMLQIDRNQSLIDFTENLTSKYIEKTSSLYRKKKGQYFTPKTISEFMIKQFDNIDKKEKIRILDPGAGIGIFESTICEYIKSKKKNIKILFDLYENDNLLLHLLDLSMRSCQENMAERGFEISYKIFNKDFVLSNSSIFDGDSCDFNSRREGYDFVVANPPYYKLRKESPHAVAMKSIIKGQMNIYVLFIALSGKLLKYGGQITVLTPRSYFSGLYFGKFRKWFFRKLKPTKIHIFKSRKILKKYNVQQEMVILTAIKDSKTPKNVIISTSNREPHLKDDFDVFKTSYEKIVIENDGNIFIRVPTSKLDEKIAEHLDKLKFNLDSLNLKISTGPVVPFRARNYLLYNIENSNDFFPLIWMQNLRDEKVKWPIQLHKKPIAIENKEGSDRLLIPNGNYVLIKRFSTKEGKRRINAYVISEKFLDIDYIGIENHVNYIHRINGKLTENEAYGIMALLNSRLYNKYFQMTNGSTQVNASEICNIPLPSLEKIRSIGSLIKEKKKDESEKVIVRELNIDDSLLFESMQ